MALQTFLRILLKSNEGDSEDVMDGAADAYQHEFDQVEEYIGSYVVRVVYVKGAQGDETEQAAEETALWNFSVIMGFRGDEERVNALIDGIAGDERVTEVRELRDTASY